MITESMLYWITRLNYIGYAISGFIAIICISLFISIAVWVSSDMDDDIKIIKKFVITSAISIIFLIVAQVLIPTTKEMCAIKIIPVILNNEKAQNMSSEVYDLAMDWFKELHPKKQQKEE